MVAFPIIPFVFMLLKLTGDITYSRLLRPNNSQLKNDQLCFPLQITEIEVKMTFYAIMYSTNSMFGWNYHMNFNCIYIIFRAIICQAPTNTMDK